MAGDRTAFACVLPDDGLGPAFEAGTVAYGTLAASPWPSSVVLLEWRDGRSAIRIVAAVDDAGMEVTRAADGGRVERVDFDLLAFVGVLKVFERP